MAIQITMPRLSDTMKEGTLNKWHVKVGDKVKSGAVLADVETDKATMELQTFDDGTVAALVVQEGQIAPVGALILALAEKNEDPQAVAKSVAQIPEMSTSPTSERAGSGDSGGSESSTGISEPPSGAVTAERSRISPLARKLAQTMNVDPATVQGTGPGGRIIKHDILTAASGSAVPPATSGGTSGGSGQAMVTTLPPTRLETKVTPISSMRRTIARRLVESKTTIPHFTVTISVNMDPLLTLRQTLNQQLESQGIKLSVNDFLVRAAALACVRHPLVNSSWSEAGIQQHGTVNLGVAVSLPEENGGGLVVPVIRDAHNKGLRAISQETRLLSEKARAKGLSAADMADGTFTISNLGMFGVEHFEAIINPPQAAILAVGAALAKPVVRAGQVGSGSEMTCTLSADHRVIDGSVAAQYLATLKQLLENPAVLLV